MIYGSLAKNLANSSGRYNVVSESDAILEYLQNEASTYSNIVFNESYIDEEERLVAEAKLEALNEAVSGAIIAAIIALLGVVLVIIGKATGLFKKAAEKIKDIGDKKKEKDGGTKEFTKEQIEQIEALIKEEADKLDYAHKDKITGYCSADFSKDVKIEGSAKNFINDGPALFKVLLEYAKQLCGISTNATVEQANSVIDPVLKKLNELKDDYDKAGIIKSKFEDKNNFFLDYWIEHQVSHNEARVTIDKYAEQALYYSKALTVERKTEDEARKLESYMKQNTKELIANMQPSKHENNKDYSTVAHNLNTCFGTMKNTIELYRLITKEWVKVENFRFRIMVIYATRGKGGSKKDEDTKEDTKEKTETEENKEEDKK
jgi:hypothetical protein